MQEIWKNIKSYDGLYQVSNLGNIKSLPKKAGRSNRGEKILNFNKNSKGYLRVELSKDKKRKQCLVHRLVAETFIPNYNNLPQINHKDENKENNCIDNLEWCDNKYNNNYGTKKQRLSISHKIRKGVYS